MAATKKGKARKGKGKSSRKDVYAQVRERIVTFIEENGTTPWRKPWKGKAGGFEWPKNVTTDRPYKGINVILLSMLGYDYPYFMTFKQAEKAGYHVRRGSKGHPVVFWNWVETKDEDTDEVKKVPFLRRYTVFNVEQVDGAEELLPQEDEEPPANPFKPIERCEEIVRAYLEDGGGPSFIERGSRACYSPERDKVRVPPRETFESPEAFYGTMFHELGHSTGHGLRLARGGITQAINFGSHTYGKEELVAEITAAFLCGLTGIDPAPLRDNQAAYVSSWLKQIHGDPKLVVLAAAQAQKATDWIMGDRPE